MKLEMFGAQTDAAGITNALVKDTARALDGATEIAIVTRSQYSLTRLISQSFPLTRNLLPIEPRFTAITT